MIDWQHLFWLLFFCIFGAGFFRMGIEAGKKAGRAEATKEHQVERDHIWDRRYENGYIDGKQKTLDAANNALKALK